jgi:hypothetical protein
MAFCILQRDAEDTKNRLEDLRRYRLLHSDWINPPGLFTHATSTVYNSCSVYTQVQCLRRVVPLYCRPDLVYPCHTIPFWVHRRHLLRSQH